MKLTKLIFSLFMTCFTVIPSFGVTPKYKNPTGKEFPILAWYSILPDSAQTKERYQELRDAGFNISFSHFYHDEEVEKALKAMEGTGVKIMATSTGIYGDTKNSVSKFKDHPGVAGWFLRDEPVASGFKDLSDFRDRIYDTDSTHLLYLNLLPSLVNAADLGTKDYEDYVQRFVDEVRLPLISYDFYPIIENKDAEISYQRPTFFENLEIVSRVARRNNIPFWAFCLSTAHDPYPIPTATHLRSEAFPALAYGAQGIQYFTYWQPTTETWNFHHAPIDETGKRTDTYYLIQDLNKEIQALAPVFLGADIEEVGHTGIEIPTGTKRISSMPAGFGDIKSDGMGVLVSRFHNGKKRYLMIVNRDIDHAQTITLTRPKGIKKINSDGSRSKDTEGAKVTIAPAGYLLYEL